MIPLDYVLAIALLAGPGDKSDPPPVPLEVMQDLAVSWQLLDPRERKFTLVSFTEWKANLHELRQLYKELRDAPPVEDHMRFPDRDLINELHTFNRQYRCYVEAYAAIDPRCKYECTLAISETDRLYEIWDNVRDAAMPFYYIRVRRKALKKLREEIGPENYYAGRLPPHVPLWRFNRVD
jgi:hypothetical protein